MTGIRWLVGLGVGVPMKRCSVPSRPTRWGSVTGKGAAP